MTFTLFRWTSHSIRLNLNIHITVRTPKIFLLSVWPAPFSLATTHGISLDFFSSPYLDVSVQAVPLIPLCIHDMMSELLSDGFPHSDIHGSMAAFASPWLFADRCVLRRLLVPRHSPCALCSLTILRKPQSKQFNWCFPWISSSSLDDKLLVLPFKLPFSHYYSISLLCSVFKVRFIRC